MKIFSNKIQSVDYPLLFIILAGSSLAIVLYRFDPMVSGIYPSCVFYSLTDHYCPGCGSARAMYNLLHFNLIKAFQNNFLMVISIPFILYELFVIVFRNHLGRHLHSVLLDPNGLKCVTAIIVLFWLIRNISIFPFNLLSP